MLSQFTCKRGCVLVFSRYLWARQMYKKVREAARGGQFCQPRHVVRHCGQLMRQDPEVGERKRRCLGDGASSDSDALSRRRGKVRGPAAQGVFVTRRRLSREAPKRLGGEEVRGDTHPGASAMSEGNSNGRY